MTNRVTIIIGTRPEAIKLAPVIIALKNCKEIETRLLLTGQHIEMVCDVLDLFGLEWDNNLELMKKNQDLNLFTSRCLTKVSKDYKEYPPKLVLVQGDTSSAFVGALAAYQENIPIGHVEAGLRTDNIKEPFPEEANRRLISQIADLHFAPTEIAKKNLIDSKVCGEIIKTGNTIIDAVQTISKKTRKPSILNLDWSKNIVLVTVHRRENWGKKLKDISEGIRQIAKKKNNLNFIFPLHKNPILRDSIREELGGQRNIYLIEPLNYLEMIECIKISTLILTDSGGIQEEAPAFGTPVLVLRNNSERMEAINAGTAKLIGTSSEKIFTETLLLIEDKKMYNSMSKSVLPFGDGKASERIIFHVSKFLS